MDRRKALEEVQGRHDFIRPTQRAWMKMLGTNMIRGDSETGYEAYLKGRWVKVDDPKTYFMKQEALKTERLFREWYSDIAKRYRLNPNPDDKRHYYDYRAAFAAGSVPDASGHWPSKYKKEGHPRLYVNGVDTRKDTNQEAFRMKKGPGKKSEGSSSSSATSSPGMEVNTTAGMPAAGAIPMGGGEIPRMTEEQGDFITGGGEDQSGDVVNRTFSGMKWAKDILDITPPAAMGKVTKLIGQIMELVGGNVQGDVMSASAPPPEPNASEEAVASASPPSSGSSRMSTALENLGYMKVER